MVWYLVIVSPLPPQVFYYTFNFRQHEEKSLYANNILIVLIKASTWPLTTAEEKI